MKDKRRIALEIKESELIKTGRDLASMVVAMPGDARTRAQARLFLRRHRAVDRQRLVLVIEEAGEVAQKIDAMIPDVPSCPLFT